MSALIADTYSALVISELIKFDLSAVQCANLII